MIETDALTNICNAINTCNQNEQQSIIELLEGLSGFAGTLEMLGFEVLKNDLSDLDDPYARDVMLAAGEHDENTLEKLFERNLANETENARKIEIALFTAAAQFMMDGISADELRDGLLALFPEKFRTENEL